MPLRNLGSTTQAKSIDHQTRERLEAAGGMVLSGTRGRTSRVFTAGGIGLAMSRSIGDPERCVGPPPSMGPSGSHTPSSPLRRRWPV